jgi:hypothetical protein
MAPAKPLPIDVPETSTNWPATKCSAVISAPTSIMLSGRHAELDQLALGLDIGDGEVGRASALGRVLHLGNAGAELHGGVAILFFGALGNNLAVFQLQHGHGDMLAGVVEDPGHAQLLCNHS